MATFCENCGKQLSLNDSFTFKGMGVCGGCLRKLQSQTTKTPNNLTLQKPVQKKRAVDAGWLCFGVALFTLFASFGVSTPLQFGAFFVYAPLFFAAFVLSIVGMAQGRIASGVTLLLVTFIIPPVLWFGLVAVKIGEAFNVVNEEKQESLSSISLEEVEATTERNYMYCKGKVRNNGTTSISYVKVGVEWLDGNGKVLDTDFTYAVSSEGLQPGAAKSFSIMSEADGRMKRFRYYVIRD